MDKRPRHAFCIELGGSHAVVALLRENRVLRQREFPVVHGSPLAPLLPEFAAAILDMRSDAPEDGEIAGVAFSLAALVDAKADRVVSTNGKYPDSQSIDLKDWCRNELGLRFAIENDTRMALMGEAFAGSARGVGSVVMVTLGTGIGGAVMVDGRPLRTSQPQGGCLGGHLPVNLHGRVCSCGAIGCMEAEASTWALPAIVRDWPGVEHSLLQSAPGRGFQQIFACADAGDAVARQVRDHCIHVWAVGTVGLVHAYGPELVLFGGGVLRAGESVLAGIREYVDRYAWQPTQRARIEKASLGPDAALYGAIPLLAERFAIP